MGWHIHLKNLEKVFPLEAKLGSKLFENTRQEINKIWRDVFANLVRKGFNFSVISGLAKDELYPSPSYTLARISSYLTFDQKSLLILINSVVKSKLNYCPPIWMFRSLSLNNSLNHKNEHSPRVTYGDHVQSFQIILEITNEKLCIKKS